MLAALRAAAAVSPRAALTGVLATLPMRFAAAVAAQSTAAATDGDKPYTIIEADMEKAKDVKRFGRYVMKGIPGHTKKLNPIARQAAGKPVNEVLSQMAFSHQKRAGVMRVAVERAVMNADFYHNLSADQLLVERAWTGKGFSSPRVRYHSKGRAGRSHYRTSRVTVFLREMTPAEQEKKARFGKWAAMTLAERKAKLDPRAY